MTADTFAILCTRVTKSGKPKYKLKDLNNVDLTKGYVDACWEELSSKK